HPGAGPAAHHPPVDVAGRNGPADCGAHAGPGPAALGHHDDVVAVVGQPGLDRVGDGGPLVGAEGDAHAATLGRRSTYAPAMAVAVHATATDLPVVTDVLTAAFA